METLFPSVLSSWMSRARRCFFLLLFQSKWFQIHRVHFWEIPLCLPTGRWNASLMNSIQWNWEGLDKVYPWAKTLDVEAAEHGAVATVNGKRNFVCGSHKGAWLTRKLSSYHRLTYCKISQIEDLVLHSIFTCRFSLLHPIPRTKGLAYSAKISRV